MVKPVQMYKKTVVRMNAAKPKPAAEAKNKRKLLTFLKQEEIINKRNSGLSINDLALDYGASKRTV